MNLQTKKTSSEAEFGSADLLDIVTVTFNSEKYLARCLSSVKKIRSKIRNFIIIDGGSTDGTLDIINEYSNIITKYISEPDDGISDAFNKGISRCSSKFILLLNSDDWIIDDYFYDILAQVKESDQVICTKMHSYSNCKFLGEFESDPRSIPKYNSMLHPGCIISSEVYKRIGGYDTSLLVGMDYDFFSRCFKVGVNFKKLDLPFVAFQEGGTSRNMKYLILKESFNIRRMHHGAKIPAHEIKQFISRLIGDALTSVGLKKFVKNVLGKK